MSTEEQSISLSFFKAIMKLLNAKFVVEFLNINDEEYKLFMPLNNCENIILYGSNPPNYDSLNS